MDIARNDLVVIIISVVVLYYFRLIFLNSPVLAWILSSNFADAIKNYSSLLVYLVQGKGNGELRKQFNFTYQGNNFWFTLYGGSPEVAALVETFVYKEYELPGLVNPNVIVDVGAHTGNTAWYFHLNFPDARIYAIEASPQSYERLVQNVASCPAVTPVHCALTDGSTETVTFYEAKSSLGSSTVARSDADASVTVSALGLAQFFALRKIERANVIKMDIEGGEEMVFKDVDPAIFSDRYIIEVHEDLMQQTGEEFRSKFKGFECTVRDIGQSGRYMLDCVLKR